MRKWVSNDQELTELIKKEESSLSSTPERPSETTPSPTKSEVIEDDDHSKSAPNNVMSEDILIKVMGVP